MFQNKLLFIASLFVAASVMLGVQAEDSYIKVKVHRNFLKDIFENTLEEIFTYTAKIHKDSMEIPNLKTELTDFNLKLTPIKAGRKNKDQSQYDIEVFFDEKDVVIDIMNIKMTGDGKVKDMNTDSLQVVKFQGIIEIAQIVLELTEELTEDSDMVPKFNVLDVIFEIKNDDIAVQAFGDLPLFQSKQFEDSIRNALQAELRLRENQWVTLVQGAIDQSLKKVHVSTLARQQFIDTSLKEQLKIDGEDYIVAEMVNGFKFQGSDIFTSSLRSVEPEFSDSEDFKTDVQIAFNENYINHQLLQAMNKGFGIRGFSLRDWVLFRSRKVHEHVATGMYGVFSTFVLKAHFPELKNSFGESKRTQYGGDAEYPVDLQCNLEKRNLDESTEHGISQVRFREGNIIEFEAHFGCDLVYNPDVDMWHETSKAANQRNETDNWVPVRQIYGTVQGKTFFDFDHANTHARYGYITGHIDDLELEFSHIQVMNGDEEIWGEEEMINTKLEQLRQAIQLSGIRTLIDTAQQYLPGPPISMFPELDSCLGLEPAGGAVEVHEGYMNVGFEYDTVQDHESCVLLMFMTEDEKKEMLNQVKNKRAKSSSSFPFSSIMSQAEDMLGGVTSMFNIDFDDIQSGVQDQFDKLTDNLGDFGNEFKDQVLKGLDDYGDDIKDMLIDGVESRFGVDLDMLKQ